MKGWKPQFTSEKVVSWDTKAEKKAHTKKTAGICQSGGRLKESSPTFQRWPAHKSAAGTKVI